jgi:hypothetical protein
MRYDGQRKRAVELAARISENDKLVQRCLALVKRFGLSEVELAALLGTTVQVPLKMLSGHRDFYRQTREGMRNFVERSEGAMVRTDLQLPEKRND